MNRFLAYIANLLDLPDHQCKPWPDCRVCLPDPAKTTPFEVRRSTVGVLRAHGPDPFTRRCTCGADTTAYFDHVVEQLANAGVLRTDGGQP